MQSSGSRTESKKIDTKGNVSFKTSIPSRVSRADVPELWIAEESSDDPGALLESLKGFDCDLHQVVPGEWYGAGNPVVFDVLVDPLVRFSSGE